MNTLDDSFGYPMNLCAYATRDIVWGPRKGFKQGLNLGCVVRSVCSR